MNITVGVMCEAAISLMQSWNNDLEMVGLLDFFKRMTELYDLCSSRYGDAVITQEILEKATSLTFQPKRLSPEIATQLLEETARINEVTKELLEDGEFMYEFRDLLRHAKLTPETVKLVFESVDYDRIGVMHLDNFIYGALCTKQDVVKLDIFASTTALRAVSNMHSSLAEKMMTCHEKMESVLEEMSALILRKEHEAATPAKDMEERRSMYNGSLSASAAAALKGLGEWEGKGVIPGVKAMGEMYVIAGTGMLSMNNCLVDGLLTRFRTEVAVGDLIVIEKEHSSPMVNLVTLVNNQEKMQVKTNICVSEKTKYLIVKRRPLGGDAKKSNVTMDLKLKQNVPPTIAQAFFEWDVQTRHHSKDYFNSLEDEHEHLIDYLKTLEEELVHVSDLGRLTNYFLAWRDLRFMPHQQTRSLDFLDI